MFACLIKACMAGVLCFTPPDEAAVPKNPVVERLNPSVQHIEGDSLPFNSQAAYLLVRVQSEVDEWELARLRYLAGRTSSLVTAQELIDDVNSMRILAFETQPGERITFNLKGEKSKIRMAVYPDPKAPQMKASIDRANLPLPSSRARKLVFTNSSKESYELLLFVYGLHGYNYHLDWERRSKK